MEEPGTVRHRQSAENVNNNESVSVDNRPTLDRTLSASEDFLCSCCYDLMVQPTTLTCGHSFCRLCIANWYFTSKKSECPQCRQVWTGNPQINITLRNLLKKMYPDALDERESETLTPEAKQKISKFDSTLSDTIESSSRSAQGQGFCGGVCLALTAIVVIYLSWYWRSSDKDLLVHKPLVKWTVDDVDQWLTDMGSWTYKYVNIVREKQLVGNLVLGLDEANIVETLNITEPLHERALINSINIIKEKGVKPASNLWEFKALYPGWALFLLYGMKDYPRTTLLYLYIFEYESLFLPFVHVVCPVSEDAPKYDFTHQNSYMTPLQWVEFLPKYIFLPYYLISEYTWDWLDIHYWTSRFILLNCFAMTLLEANYIVMYMRGERRVLSLTEELKKMFKSYLSIGLFVIFWPVVPSFVCDCFFYVAMYFSPYQAGEQTLRLWRN